MNDLIQRVFSDYNVSQRLEEADHFTLSGFFEDLQLFSDYPRKANEESQQKLGDVLLHVHITILSLGGLVLSALRSPEDENVILKKGFAAKDLFLGNYLTDICNTALCICRNASDGFDTQARILFRTLDERLQQAIVLFYSNEDYDAWHKAQEAADAKQAYYTLFSRKKRLLRRLEAIERELGFYSDTEVSEWRLERSEYFSESVHGSGVAVNIGSWAFAYDRDHMTPALFGRASAASIHTLEQTRFHLYYFSQVLHRLLRDVHHWSPNLKLMEHRHYDAHKYLADVFFQMWKTAIFRSAE